MKRLFDTRKGQEAGTGLIMWASIIIVLIVMLILGAVFLEDMKDDIASCPSTHHATYNGTSKLCQNATTSVIPDNTGYNITVDGENALQEFSSKANLIVLAIVFGVILTILIGIVMIVRRNIA